MTTDNWKDALEGLTPEDVMAMRRMRRSLRHLLLAQDVSYSTRPTGARDIFELIIPVEGRLRTIESTYFDDGYITAAQYLLLALNEVIWMDEDLAKPAP